MAKILVVDDEIGIRELLSEILYDEGHTVVLAENAAQARAARLAGRPDLVLLDIWMPDTDGVTLLKEWASQGMLDMPVIMMSGHATIDTAVEATRIGALDFMEKPITLQRLLKAVESGLQARPTNTPSAAAPRSTPAEPAASAAPLRPNPLAPVPTATPEPSVAADHSPPGMLGSIPLDQPLREARDAFERIYFEHHLQAENGSMTRVAEKTGLERTHLYRKLRQLGVDVSRRNRAAQRNG